MSRPIPPGPRGVHGAQAMKQGLFTNSGTKDSGEIANRKHNERSQSSKAIVKKRTDNEYDILTGDLLMTKLRNVYADNADPHRVPVISTLAGLETDAPWGTDPSPQDMAKAMMKRYAFAGVSMTRITDKTEMPGRIPPQSDLPIQIAGVTTLPIYKQDAPFGRIARAVPNGDPKFTQGHLGTNHRHLVVEIDGRDASFGQRLQRDCFDRYHGFSSTGGQDPVSLDSADCLDKLVDFLAVAVVAAEVARDLTQNGQRKSNALAEAVEVAELLKRSNKTLRANFMAAMFAGLTPATLKESPQLEAKYMADPKNISLHGVNNIDKVHLAQVTASAEFFTAMMDLMRQDNMWMIGKVIRGGKAPGECDVMLL
jgi:hypothetical protein